MLNVLLHHNQLSIVQRCRRKPNNCPGGEMEVAVCLKVRVVEVEQERKVGRKRSENGAQERSEKWWWHGMAGEVVW